MADFNSFNPFDKNMQQWMKHLQENSIEDYIQDILSKSIPSTYQNFNPLKGNFWEGENKSDSINESVFETHDDVYIIIPIPNSMMHNQLKVYHTSNLAIVEGIPTSESRNIITLPSLVQQRGGTASIKNNILQIKLLKNVDTQFTELNTK